MPKTAVLLTIAGALVRSRTGADPARKSPHHGSHRLCARAGSDRGGDRGARRCRDGRSGSAAIRRQNPHHGDYRVRWELSRTGTGAAVKGMHVDIYVPSEVETKQFGTKRVRVQIRQMGTGKAVVRRKDTASH